MFEIVTAPRGAQSAHPGQTFALPEFPAHRFTESGTPIRVSRPRRGIQPTLGEEAPILAKNGREWFRLPHSSGSNRVVSREAIREKLLGIPDKPIAFRQIPDFPRNLFDDRGGCYRLDNHKPVTASTTNLAGELRYRIWSASKQAYVYLTNVTIIRYFSGKCTLDRVCLPEGYREHFEYPGYAFHISGESVIRCFSGRRRLSTPVEITFTNDWSVLVTHLDGHRVRLNKRQIAELAGNFSSEFAATEEPTPEPVAAQREINEIPTSRPIWPPHLR